MWEGSHHLKNPHNASFLQVSLLFGGHVLLLNKALKKPSPQCGECVGGVLFDETCLLIIHHSIPISV